MANNQGKTDSGAKAWLITGANSGLGLELARAALRRGERVIAAAREPERLADLVASSSDRVLPVQIDVTEPDTIASAVSAALDRFGRIDVLVNNAGYGFIGGVEEASEAEYRHQFEVNFFGVVAATRAVMPTMRSAGGGTIVNMSSIAGLIGSMGAAFYSASKFALEGFSESLAQEGSPFGIRVLIVEPGPFRTEFFGRSMAAPARLVPGYEMLDRLRLSMRERDGRQAGDPVRAAEAILDTVALADMPLRLLLGRSTYRRGREAMLARVADFERSQSLAESADFPDCEGKTR